MTANLRTLGIDVQPSLSEATSWDYELLYLPESAKEIAALTLEADIHRARLPRRIVVGGAKRRDEGVCAFTTAQIAPTQEESILKVYDEWISFLLKRRGLNKVSLSLFFENLPIAEKAWQSVDNNKPSYIEEIVAFDGNASFKMDEKCRVINLWRHKTLAQFLQGVNPTRVIYYQHCTYGDPFFAYLCSVNPQISHFQAQYLLRQLVEMALCRVVIVDERIAQTVDSKRSNQLGESLAHILAWMGIWVVGRVEFRKEGQVVKVVEDNQQKNAVFTIGAEPNSENGLVTLVMDYDKDGKFNTQVKYPDGLQGFPEIPSKIEILTVHQTIIDGEFQKPLQELQGGNQRKERWILGLKPQVLFVYSHSGRGHPRELLPKNASFLEYSFLQTHILSQPSKFFFVQLALASKEPRR